MRFYNIQKRKPNPDQWCFIKEKDDSGKRILLFSQPQQYDKERGFVNHWKVVSWAPIPPHALERSNGWVFPYNGGDWPDRDAECLICTNRRHIKPKYAFFSEKLYKFLGVPEEDVIAYQFI